MVTSTIYGITRPKKSADFSPLALTKGERIALGRRGHALSAMLQYAEANVPMRELLEHGLELKCYEAVAGALRLWEEMDATERAAIEKCAADAQSPEAFARRMESCERLIHCIQSLTEDGIKRNSRRQKRCDALLAAYRDELAFRQGLSKPIFTMFDLLAQDRPIPTTTTELTITEKNKLLAIRARAIGSEHAA